MPVSLNAGIIKVHATKPSAAFKWRRLHYVEKNKVVMAYAVSYAVVLAKCIEHVTYSVF